MPVLVALLRAVNVGGTGKLVMRELADLVTSLGFTDVRTYIQSGNVVFRTRLLPEKAGAVLERALAAHMGKPVGVVMRDAAALRAVVDANPFPDAPPSKVLVVFSLEALTASQFAGLKGPAGEEVVARAREVYVHYPNGMGRSKLKLPKVRGVTTVRNINTVMRLVEMCEAVGQANRVASAPELVRRSGNRAKHLR